MSDVLCFCLCTFGIHLKTSEWFLAIFWASSSRLDPLCWTKVRWKIATMPTKRGQILREGKHEQNRSSHVTVFYKNRRVARGRGPMYSSRGDSRLWWLEAFWGFDPLNPEPLFARKTMQIPVCRKTVNTTVKHWPSPDRPPIAWGGPKVGNSRIWGEDPPTPNGKRNFLVFQKGKRPPTSRRSCIVWILYMFRGIPTLGFCGEGVI